jgi:hypothetical protein
MPPLLSSSPLSLVADQSVGSNQSFVANECLLHHLLESRPRRLHPSSALRCDLFLPEPSLCSAFH